MSFLGKRFFSPPFFCLAHLPVVRGHNRARHTVSPSASAAAPSTRRCDRWQLLCWRRRRLLCWHRCGRRTNQSCRWGQETDSRRRYETAESEQKTRIRTKQCSVRLAGKNPLSIVANIYLRIIMLVIADVFFPLFEPPSIDQTPNVVFPQRLFRVLPDESLLARQIGRRRRRGRDSGTFGHSSNKRFSRVELLSNRLLFQLSSHFDSVEELLFCSNLKFFLSWSKTSVNGDLVYIKTDTYSSEYWLHRGNGSDAVTTVCNRKPE